MEVPDLYGVSPYILAAVIAAIISGLAVYIANNSSGYTAGFLFAFPTALVTLFFVKKDKLHEVTKTFTLGAIAYVSFALIIYYLDNYSFEVEQKSKLLIGLSVWVVITIILFIIGKNENYL
jgi:uncharacterized membrane protein (GlpM family)